MQQKKKRGARDRMSRNLVDFDLEVSETRPAALELKFEKHRKKKKNL